MGSMLGRVLSLAREQRGFVIVTLGNLVGTGLGALTWLALAKILTVESYGYANYVLSIAALLSGFSILGLPVTVQTYLPKGEEVVLPASIALVTLASLALSLPLVAIHPLIPPLVLGYALFALATKERLGRGRYRDYGIMYVVTRLSLLLASVALAMVMGAEGVVLGFVLSLLASSAWIYRYAKEVRESLRALRGYLGFVLPAFAASAVVIMGTRLDKVLIGALLGNEMLGHYYLAFQFYAAISIIPLSLLNFLIPEKSRGRGTRVVEVAGVLLSLAVALLGFFALPEVVRILFPKFYPESAVAVRIVSLAVVFDSIYNIWMASRYSEERPREVLLVNAVSVSALAALIPILGLAMGVAGLALALLTSRVVAAIAGASVSVLAGR